MTSGAVVNINDTLNGHVALEADCVDRLYLNAYVPNLQGGGQVERFCKVHLGQPIASLAVIEKIGNRFRRETDAFAKRHRVPVLHLQKPDRKALWRRCVPEALRDLFAVRGLRHQLL